MIIQINKPNCVSHIALGDMKLSPTNNGQHVAIAKVVAIEKAPLFMFTWQRMPYTPTGTTYGGKAKYSSYFVPLEVTDGVLMQFFGVLEARMKRLLFEQRDNLFEKPEQIKNHLAIDAKFTWQTDRTKDDGTPFPPLFQPRLKKEWTKDKQVLPTFDCVCTVLDLEKKKKDVKLSETNLSEHLLPNSSVSVITTMREIRVVGNRALFEMDVVQLLVIHKEPPELQKNTLCNLLGWDDDCATSVASEPNSKKRRAGSASVPEEEEMVLFDEVFESAAAAMIGSGAAVVKPPAPSDLYPWNPKKKKPSVPKKNELKA